MPIGRSLTSIGLVVSFAAGGLPARPLMLGIVTQAKDAILCTGPVSAGTTVYDGDLLSTDAEGALTVRGLGPA
jgi:hypothetical protein